MTKKGDRHHMVPVTFFGLKLTFMFDARLGDLLIECFLFSMD